MYILNFLPNVNLLLSGHARMRTNEAMKHISQLIHLPLYFCNSCIQLALGSLVCFMHSLDPCPQSSKKRPGARVSTGLFTATLAVCRRSDHSLYNSHDAWEFTARTEPE